MRMAFGLVGLLVTLGIIVLLMSQYLNKSSADIKAGNQARDEVKQIGGMSEDATPAIHSFATDSIMQGGRLDNLLVTAVAPGGAADKYFGLRKDDAIIEVSMGGSLMKVSDIGSGDAELAKAQVVDAFSKKQQIKVVRDGQEMVLPAAKVPGVPTPAAAKKDSGNPLSQQLDAIQSQGGGR